MDILSHAIAFLLGSATGAAGKYYADKYTDVRREKKIAKDQDIIWQDIERRFPAIISEMREDFSVESCKAVRAFFVKESAEIMGPTTEPAFTYHPDEHADLRPAILLLEQHGFVAEITPGKTPMYRMHEKLVDRLHPVTFRKFA